MPRARRCSPSGSNGPSAPIQLSTQLDDSPLPAAQRSSASKAPRQRVNSARDIGAPCPGTSTYMRNDGTWSNPVTTSAVNSAFGASESDVCQLVATDSGTATVAGSGFNLNCTVSGVQTVGSGNTVVIQTISDARLKQDIEDEALGLAFIQQLRPRTYRMRSNPALRYHGFIYQEVAELMRDDTPDALALHRPGSYGGVDYMSLLAPLVRSVQQLAARVQQLESA